MINEEQTISSSGNNLGNALVGGMILGPIGAVIGATSTKDKLEHRVYRLGINIVIDDLNNPNVYFNFVYIYVPEGSSAHKQAFSEAQKWYSRILVLMERSKNSKSLTANNSEQLINK